MMAILALLERALAKTGQVIIHVRDVKIHLEERGKMIILFHLMKFQRIFKEISLSGYKINEDFVIQLVPNITNITYGRGVGYKIEEESFSSDVESISATKIRKDLRDEGKIK